MHLEPNPPGKRQYRTKMVWWYERIIDIMIAEPHLKIGEIAQRLGKSHVTISMIINSDMFKAAYARRRQQFVEQHDFGIIAKTTQIAHAGLDAILKHIEKKQDQVPLALLDKVTGSALDRLGYGTQETPAAAVQVNVNNQQVVLPPQVTRQDLEQARQAVRQIQEQKLLPAAAPAVEEAVLVPSEEEDS